MLNLVYVGAKIITIAVPFISTNLNLSLNLQFLFSRISLADFGALL